MWNIMRIFFCVYLGVIALLDIRSRKMPIWIIAAGGIGVGIYRCIVRDIPWEVCLFGAAVGIVFLFISKVTKESFGYGDSLLILVIGVGVGFWNLVSLLLVSFFLSSIVAAGMLIAGKFQRKTALPFVPFLGLGYFFIRILGGG